MTARAITNSATSARRRRARAFTLPELMVAMSGGLFISIAVFALSRDATRFYQREGRIANATLTVVSGFERLASDVSRAGHLSTPNIQSDPSVCNRPDASFPPALRSLRALVVGSSLVSGTEVAAAKITPHSLLISGALNTPEVFTTMAVAQVAGGWQVHLDLGTPAAARLNLVPGAAAKQTNEAILNTIFLIGNSGRGKLVRLRRNGLDQYGAVSSVNFDLDGRPYLTLANPSLIRLVRGGPQCGVDDTGKGMSLSVIDLVRYDIRSMKDDAAYSGLREASAQAPFESGRAELVRVELDADLNEVASTLEIVGEYAVDLRVGAWGASTFMDPTLVPVEAETIAQNYASTHLLRGVHLRLSVRSREADRDENVTGNGASATNLFRIGLGPNGSAPFARVRTLQTDVPLRNLEGARWEPR